MKSVTPEQAVEKLSAEIAHMQCDDLAEVYNEFFPNPRVSEAQVREDKDAFFRKINDYIAKGLEIEEILDLWHVVFPASRRVRFDEDTNCITYRDEPALYAD